MYVILYAAKKQNELNQVIGLFQDMPCRSCAYCEHGWVGVRACSFVPGGFFVEG